MRSKGNADAGAGAERMDAAARTAGVLAHEFANILGTVRTMTALLEEELDPESESASDLEIVVGAVEAGEGLLRALRAFVHPPDLGDGVAELGEVTRAALDEAGPADVPGRAVELSAHGGPLHVRALPAQLKGVLSRLLRVLLEELPADGAMRIQVLADPDGLPRGWLSVECAGLAARDGLAARLFEPFALGNAHHTGLALPAVYAAVTKAGGVATAEASPGRGLTIRLGLPLASGDADDPRASAR